jgi:hypothetical protein
VIVADAAVAEQQPQPVVVEVAVSAGDPLGVLDFQVEILGQAVRHRAVVEVRNQLDPPQVGVRPVGPTPGSSLRQHASIDAGLSSCPSQVIEPVG